jgi:hypothetical protein
LIRHKRIKVRRVHSYPEVCPVELKRFIAAATEPARREQPEEMTLLDAIRLAESINLEELAANALAGAALKGAALKGGTA